jgi:hypothetical protein
MGKAGRLACIFVPMGLTVVALILLVLLGLAQTNADSYYLSNLYFLRANTTGVSADHTSGFTDNPANNVTDSADISNGHIVVYNYYSVGLWNYCAGGGVMGVAGTENEDPAANVAFCTPRDVHFAFNPITVWGLDSTFTTEFFSKDLTDALSAYESSMSKAIGPLYIVTVCAAGVQIILGLFAIMSRLGSLVTTLSALVTTVLAGAFAIVSTIAFLTLDGAFNAALNKEGFSFEYGAQALAYTWLVVAFSLVGTLFWAFSSCCCSGKSDRSSRRGRGGEKLLGADNGEYGYQRMGSPQPPAGFGGHGGATAYSMGPISAPAGREGAYEPYRQVGA